MSENIFERVTRRGEKDVFLARARLAQSCEQTSITQLNRHELIDRREVINYHHNMLKCTGDRV